jgi:hypothetical protein
VLIWYIFPVLVCCTKKNLATLHRTLTACSDLFCVDDAQNVHPRDHAEARVLRRFRACAGESPPGDDGLTDADVAAGTASDDRKCVELVHASRIIRRLKHLGFWSI